MRLFAASKILSALVLVTPSLGFVPKTGSGFKILRLQQSSFQMDPANDPTQSDAMEIDNSPAPAFAKNNGSLGDPMGLNFETEGSQPQPREIVVGAESNNVMEQADVPPPFANNNGSLGDPMGPSFEAEGAQPQPREILVHAEHNEVLEQADVPPTMANNNGSLGAPLGPSFNAEGANPEPREIMVGPDGNW